MRQNHSQQLRVKKLIYLLVFIALQSFYVFGCLVVTFSSADLLPRIVNTILFWFVLPIVGIPFVGITGEKILNLLKIYLDEDSYIFPYAITAATLWIPMLIGVNVGVDEYFQLKMRGEAVSANLAEASHLTGKGFVELREGVVKSNWWGKHTESTTLKTGDKVTTSTIDYFCIPVFNRDEQIYAPATVWLCSISDSLMKPGFKPESVRGRVVHDRYDQNFFSLAIQNAEERHGVNSVEKPLVLEFGKETYTELLQRQNFVVILFGTVVGMIWVLLATVCVAKMIPVEGAVEESRFGNYDAI